MKTTNEYLDKVKKVHGLKSDYALAKYLETSTAVITRYRKNLSTMDDLMAVKIAKALSLEPIITIAAGNAERAKDEKTRELWNRLSKVAAIAALAIAAYIDPSSTSNPLNSIIFSLYVMSNYKKTAQTKHKSVIHQPKSAVPAFPQASSYHHQVGVTTGNVTVARKPLPSSFGASSSVAPRISAMRWTMDSPSPEPSCPVPRRR